MKYLKTFFENNEEIDYLEKYGLYPEDVKDMFYDLEELGYTVSVNFSEKLIQKSTTDKTFEFNLEPYVLVTIRKKSHEGMSQRMVQLDIQSLFDSQEFKSITDIVNSRLSDYGLIMNHINKKSDTIFISIYKNNI